MEAFEWQFASKNIIDTKIHFTKREIYWKCWSQINLLNFYQIDIQLLITLRIECGFTFLIILLNYTIHSIPNIVWKYKCYHKKDLPISLKNWELLMSCSKVLKFVYKKITLNYNTSLLIHFSSSYTLHAFHLFIYPQCILFIVLITQNVDYFSLI